MKLKKSELNTLLITISSTKTTGEIRIDQGLLNEKITLGLKRRLQKIYKEAYPLYEEYLADLKECDGNEDEIKMLNDEEVTINHDPVSLAIIEAIETEHNYDWTIIEKIAE